MVNEAFDVAEKLAGDGIDVEVIDPRTLQPLDTDTIVESVRKTNRVVVVHEAVRFGGLGAEVAAQIQEEAFDYLDAPISRIAAPFSPVPFSPSLEQHYQPSAARIEQAIRDIVARPGV
jgi:pyruvate/2-oxoglutarate/acetoin dehydrogenase E1 component